MPSKISTVVQAGILAATSNILAQVITNYNADKPLQHYSFDVAALWRFVTYIMLSAPPNMYWQEWLEETFPGTTQPAETSEKKAVSKEKSGDPPPPGRLNKRNTAIKFSLDQTIGSALNTSAYLATMAAMQGKGTDEILQTVKTDLLPYMIAAWKFWPLISLISFTMIPVQKRLLFASAVGVVWGVIMCLMESSR